MADSAMRTGLLIGGPADGQAARVVVGQTCIYVPIMPELKAEFTPMTFDPVVPQAIPTRVAYYDRIDILCSDDTKGPMATIDRLPTDKFEFYRFVGWRD